MADQFYYCATGWINNGTGAPFPDLHYLTLHDNGTCTLTDTDPSGPLVDPVTVAPGTRQFFRTCGILAPYTS